MILVHNSTFSVVVNLCFLKISVKFTLTTGVMTYPVVIGQCSNIIES